MPEQREISEEEMKNMSAEEIAELQKQNCIFCKIAAKQIPAKILHEDDQVICVLDINPASEGHILVYPKEHYMILPHIPEDLLAALFSTVKLMSATLLRTLQCKGTSVYVANGMAAGQRAPHVLIHVFPRREGDSLLELPKAEVKEEENQKIKSQLTPYLYQLFGGKASKVTQMPQTKESTPVKQQTTKEDIATLKAATQEVEGKSDKVLEDEKKERKKRKEEVREQKESEEENQNIQDEIPLPKPPPEASRPAEKKPVNLDDISRLFR